MKVHKCQKWFSSAVRWQSFSCIPLVVKLLTLTVKNMLCVLQTDVYGFRTTVESLLMLVVESGMSFLVSRLQQWVNPKITRVDRPPNIITVGSRADRRLKNPPSQSLPGHDCCVEALQRTGSERQWLRLVLWGGFVLFSYFCPVCVHKSGCSGLAVKQA